MDEERGRSELDDILAQLKAGIPLEQIVERYRPEKQPISAAAQGHAEAGGISFHEYASQWLARRLSAEIGDGPLSDNTHTDYRWRLAKYLLPHFADMPVAAIRADDCRAFRARLLADAAELRAMIEAGAEPRDHRGRRRKPLGPAAIRKQMALLAQILDEAVDDGHRTDNPARSKKLRVRVPKPNRSFLEIDQLAAIIDAAGELEDQPRTSSRAKLTLEQGRGDPRQAALGRNPESTGARVRHQQRRDVDARQREDLPR